MEKNTSPFLGNIKVKSVSGFTITTPTLKAAFDVSFLAMLAALALAGLTLYFRHMGVNEKAAFTLVLYGAGVYFGFTLVWFFWARMLAFAPRFRLAFSCGVMLSAALALALIPTLLYRLAFNFEATKAFLDMDKVAHVPKLLSNTVFFDIAAKTTHLYYPLGLVIPLLFGFWFFWRTSSSQ